MKTGPSNTGSGASGLPSLGPSRASINGKASGLNEFARSQWRSVKITNS